MSKHDDLTEFAANALVELEGSFPAWEDAPTEPLDEQDALYAILDDETRDEDLTDMERLERDLATLRSKYSILVYGGKALICFRHPLLGLQFQRFEAFRKYHAHMWYTQEVSGSDGKRKEPRKVYATKVFEEDPRTTRYENIVFDPTGKAAPQSWNLWTGFKVQPVEGDVTLFLELMAALCNDDKECEEYFLNYLAHMVQKPWDLPGKAIVMRGAQGIGKGTIMQTIGSFTDNFKHLSTAESLTGNFSGHLIDAFIVFSDEAIHTGDKKAESKMKTMITESTMRINAKGKDEIEIRNYIRLFIASNEEFAAPIGEGDRRYFMLDCSPRYKGQVEPGQFFHRYNTWLQDGGREAIFHMLKNRDISEFDPRLSPKTAARLQLLLKSLSPAMKFVYELVAGNIILSDKTQSTSSGKIRWARKALYKDMLEWLPTQGIKEVPTADDLGKSLNKALTFELDNQKWKTNWKTRDDYYYEVADITVAMERFAKNIADTSPAQTFFNYEELKSGSTQEPAEGD